MNVFDWAASESKSNIFLLRRLVDYPLLAWLRWNTGFSMDIIRVGFKYTVLGSIGILFALVGLSLSILSSALNRAIPAAPTPQPASQHESEGVRRRRHSRAPDVSTTSQSSQSELRLRLPIPAPPTPRIVIEPIDVVTAGPDAASIPPSSPGSSTRPRPLAHDSLEESGVSGASTPERGHVHHDEGRHRESRRPLSVKRLTMALEQRKRLLRTQSIAVTSAASQVLSIGTSSGSASASSSKQQLSGVAGSQDVSRPAANRTASAPQDLVKPKFLPRKQHSAPPDKRSPSVQRTDPYGAPYFFPTPGSPEAADYVRQVRSSRSSSKPPAGHVTFEQRLESSSKGKSPMTSVDSPQLDPPAPVHSRTFSEDRIERRASLDSAPPTTKSTRRKSWHVTSRLPATEETAEAGDNAPARTGRVPLYLQRVKLEKSRSSPPRSRQPSVPSSPVPLPRPSEVSSPVGASSEEPKSNAPKPPDPPSRKRLWRSLQHRR